jgi:hypothetical protein
MSLLLGIFDRALPGTGLYLAFVSSLFFVSLMLVLFSVREVRWPALIFLIVFLCGPLVLIYQGIIWKDVLFANLTVFAFAYILSAEKHSQRRRYILYSVAMLALCLGASTRQNGFVLIPFFVVAVLILEGARLTGWNLLRTTSLALVISIGLVAVVSLSVSLLVRSVSKVPPSSSIGWGVTQVARYDIAGIIARGGETSRVQKIFLDNGADFEQARSDAKHFYGADRIDWLDMYGYFGREMRKLSQAQIQQIWFTLIADNPGAYVRHRLDVLRWMLWPPSILKCLPVHTGVTGPSEVVQELQLTPGMRKSDERLEAYARPFVTTIFYRHGFFAAAGLVLAVLLAVVPNRSNRSRAVSAMLVGALATTLSFAVIGLACDYRYMYFLDVLVGISVLAALCGLDTKQVYADGRRTQSPPSTARNEATVMRA